MSTILHDICVLEARQLELRRETAHRWLTADEQHELSENRKTLAALWRLRRAEMAGASEAARREALETVQANARVIHSENLRRVRP